MAKKKTRTFTQPELDDLIKSDSAFKFGDDYYWTYYMEIQSDKGDKKIQCDKCHDVFKKPFRLFMGVNKPLSLWICPNGCQSVSTFLIE